MANQLNWCFTDNAPEKDSTGEYLCPVDPAQFKYFVAQVETAPETGHIHWQGYVQLHKKARLSGVQKLFPHGVHLEPSKGKPHQAALYCQKLETRLPGTEPIIFGTLSYSGKRNDIVTLRDEIKKGKTFRELTENDDLLSSLSRHMKFHDRLRLTIMPPIKHDRKFILLYGKPRSGKTTFAFEHYAKTDDFYVTPLSNGTAWFDGYDGQKYVLFDDFDGAASGVKLDFILRLLDKWPVMVPTKGSHAWFNPDIVMVTTNLKPSEWYNFTRREVKYEALISRFHEGHCWDIATGFYTHLKNNKELVDYFPFEEREIDNKSG